MLLKRFDAEMLVTLIIFVFVYMVSVTVADYIQALYARWLGDDTAEDEGFLSLNPLQHIDPVGFFFLLVFGFGWGRMVPINTDKISEPKRRLKIFTLFFSDVLVHLILATAALFLLVVFFKMFPSNALINKIFMTGVVPLRDLADLGNYTSLMIVLALILVSFVFYNIFLAMLSIVLNIVRFMFLIGVEDGYSYMEYADYLIFWGPLILIFFFSGPLKVMLLSLVRYLVYLLAGG